MFKRVTWFAVGAAAGVGGSAYAKKRVKEAIDRLAPEHVQQVARHKARMIGGRVVGAAREGRSAMHEREQELRGRRPGQPAAIETSARVGGANAIRGRQTAR